MPWPAAIAAAKAARLFSIRPVAVQAAMRERAARSEPRELSLP